MKSPIITPIIFLLTLLPFIWLILVTCSSPITTTLKVSRIYDADGKALIDMGVLGGCAKAFDELEQVKLDTHGIDCQRRAPGWRVRPFFPYSSPPPTDPNRGSAQRELIRTEGSLPLIIVPIVTGMVGIVLVLFIAAWTGGSRRWARTLHVTNFSFYVVSTAAAWVAFGMCIRISQITNDNLKRYNDGDGSNGTPSLAIPLEARHGNATWLTLSSSIVLLFATILYGVKMFGKRAPAEQDQYNLQAAKPFGADDTSSA